MAYNRSLLRLETQQNFAIASDQRSLVLAGVSVASAALIFQATESSAFVAYGEGAALFFLVSAFAAILSALPQRQYSAGDTPKNLESNINNDEDFDLVKLGLCSNNAEYIDKNEEAAKLRLSAFKFAALMFAVGVLTALIGLIVGDST